MSILIKGMDMPKSCNDCLFTQNSICQLVGHSWNWGMMERRSDCPLVEVQTPHGRLIDAGKLIEERDWIFFGGGNNAYIKFSDVNYAPTVIEAEE